MLKVDRSNKTLSPVHAQALSDVGIRERNDLQQMIRNSPEVFFGEMGEHLLLVAEELRPSTTVDDRIDLLALDPSGALIVIELKRARDKLQLLQALSYAAMVSKWSPDEVVDLLSKFKGCSNVEAKEEIENFIEGDPDIINRAQRILLFASEFDFEVLATAEWLCERYDLDIRCHRLQLCCDNGADYLACSCVFPPAELAQNARLRRRFPHGSVSEIYSDWQQALEGVSEPVANFFRSEVERGQTAYLRKRLLRFEFDGRNRWHVSARRDRAYAWQLGRFDGDIEFWNTRLGDGANAEPVKRGLCLRFFLRTPEQFQAFIDAIAQSKNFIQFREGDESLQNDEEDP